MYVDKKGESSMIRGTARYRNYETGLKKKHFEQKGDSETFVMGSEPRQEGHESVFEKQIDAIIQ